MQSFLTKYEKTDELKDDSSKNVAELFKLLLVTKMDAFHFAKDGNGAKEGDDGSSDNPIFMENLIIDLVYDKSKEETSTEMDKDKETTDSKPNRELEGKEPPAKDESKEGTNTDTHKEKESLDSKTNKELDEKNGQRQM